MRKRPKKVISGDRTELPNGHDHVKGPDCDADFETLRAIALPVTEEFMKRIADLVSDVEVRLNKPLKPEDDWRTAGWCRVSAIGGRVLQKSAGSIGSAMFVQMRAVI
jgi:hypothetical protein